MSQHSQCHYSWEICRFEEARLEVESEVEDSEEPATGDVCLGGGATTRSQGRGARGDGRGERGRAAEVEEDEDAE